MARPGLSAPILPISLNRRGPTVTLVGPDGQLLEEARRRVEEGEARLLRGDNPSLASAELQAAKKSPRRQESS